MLRRPVVLVAAAAVLLVAIALMLKSPQRTRDHETAAPPSTGTTAAATHDQSAPASADTTANVPTTKRGADHQAKTSTRPKHTPEPVEGPKKKQPKKRQLKKETAEPPPTSKIIVPPAITLGGDLDDATLPVRLTTPSGTSSFVTTDTIELTAGESCVQWAVINEADPNDRRADAATILTIRPKPPVAPYGRSEALSYVVYATEGYRSAIIRLHQDDIDTLRQQYVDMHKRHVPARDAFVSDAALPAGLFKRVQSRDGMPLAVFTVQNQFDQWESAYGRLIINRAYSSPRHNHKISGAAESQHIYGRAIDVASNDRDWLAKRNAVRDTQACIEPLKLSKSHHVHADWRPLDRCAAKWRNTTAAAAVGAPPTGGIERVRQLLSRIPRPYFASDHQTTIRTAGGAVAGAVLGKLAHGLYFRNRRSPCASPPCPPRARPEWKPRAALIDDIPIADLGQDERWTLIMMLAAENEYVQWQWEHGTTIECEDYSGYYIDLALTVAELDDARATDALAAAMDVAPAVSVALAELGDAAVPAVLGRLRDDALADSAAYTLRYFLQAGREKRAVLSPRNEQRIVRALRRIALRARNIEVRRTAIRSLSQATPDPRLRSLIRALGLDPRFHAEAAYTQRVWREHMPLR